ncbi:MAG TPA: FAD-dependent oxidoreductase [Cyclobacteriaceae bacterium]|nr:FAD-dependent oxidoreductase [Cyclobacteriaceae bacterium]
MKIRFIILVVVLLLGCAKPEHQDDSTQRADVIIYGGTSAAITAAVQVLRMGRSVIIVCPEKHLGGMSSSGLGFTDTGNKEVIGGLAREFYHRVYQYYQDSSAWKWQRQEAYGNKGQGTPALDGENRTMWIFEPHIAEQVFEDFIRENNIQVYRNEWLDRQQGVVKQDNRITSIKMVGGKVYAGDVFIDATYEGDLMAAAGVKYHVGRESNDQYHEEFNGSQIEVFHHGHHFGGMKVSPYVIPEDSSSGLLPRISREAPKPNGEADDRIQAYCFRLCLTQVEANRVPFARPDGYDSTQYELLLRIYARGWRQTFDKFDPIPNLKTDVNNHGPFSFDNIGMNYDYPEASYERRAEIVKEHENYQKGWLYFIANDKRIPKDVQSEMQKWGLAKDEFKDNGNWPYQLYIREARRMIGESVMTENEVMGRRTVKKPIGMGSYTMDSHNVQRYITPEGYVQNEGDIGVDPPRPYQIDLGTILPRKDECSNLIVPVTLSSSHIAYGSIRMEPVFMILGQSSGAVAALAVERESSVQEVPYEKICKQLITDGQVLSISEEK